MQSLKDFMYENPEMYELITNAIQKGSQIDTTEKTEKEIQQEEKKLFFREIINSKIPQNYRENTLNYYNFKPDSLISRYLKNMRYNMKKGLGIFLSGNPGTGKTCFGWALIKLYIWNHIYTKNINKCHFTTFKEMQDSINSAEDRHQRKLFYIGRSLLVIDEFCADGELTSSAKNNLLEILNKRIANESGYYGKPTVFTSNQDLETIKNLAGPAIQDRINGFCIKHEFTTKSRRNVMDLLKLD